MEATSSYWKPVWSELEEQEDPPRAARSLCGRFRPHHATILRITMAHMTHLEEAIAALDAEVDALMIPFSAARDHLDTITGVGKRAAECIIAETALR